MKQLSSGTTPLNRTFVPVLLVIFACILPVASGGHLGFLWLAYPLFGYTIWRGRRLSDVWLDGDMLQVKGPGGSFRVPLGEVLMLASESYGRSRLIILGLDHPVGKVKEVRFIPEGASVAFGPSPADALEKDLQARIHAARAARKS
jgi:hypothetical protein